MVIKSSADVIAALARADLLQKTSFEDLFIVEDDIDTFDDRGKDKKQSAITPAFLGAFSLGQNCLKCSFFVSEIRLVAALKASVC